MVLRSFYQFHDLTVDDISRLNKRVKNLETTRNPQIEKIEERINSLESFQSFLMACKQDAIARGAKAEDSVAATTPNDINYDPEWGKCLIHILGKEPCSCEVYDGIPMEHACCHSCGHPRNSHEKRSEAATVTTQQAPVCESCERAGRDHQWWHRSGEEENDDGESTETPAVTKPDSPFCAKCGIV